jgi:Protein of unknown function (DUF2848)
MSQLEHRLTFTIHRGGHQSREIIPIRHAVIAGWTGRDVAALEKHIRELEALGVARPATTPIFYRVAASRLTTATAIEATGEESSGEVEFLLVQYGGALYVGVGSDHTDRKVEAYNVTVSKQMCEKPIAGELWAFDEVRPHWDKLILRSWACEGAAKTLYQEGTVAAMRPPLELIELFGAKAGLAEGTLMFCGTLAAKGGIRPAPRFEFELEDPVRSMRIRSGYDIATLPVLG